VGATDSPSGFAAQRQLVADLYVSTRENVYRSLIAAGLNASKAEEATQEAFLRLYVALRDGGNIENPRAWVYRVAYNNAVDSVGKNSRELGASNGMLEGVMTRERSAEQNLIEQERLDRIHQALHRLSGRQRLVLELRAQGLRYHEIAEVLQIRPSTVGEFLRRAIKQLRKFNPCGEEK
jgi:RNA polymerase sigma-70 factor, ECF subfamily